MGRLGDTALSKPIDELAVDSIMEQVNINSTYLNNIVDKIVSTYSAQLDSLMDSIRTILYDESQEPITDAELEQACLKLPLNLYYVSQGQEALGIKEDVSKSVKSEIYNKVVTESIGTIPDKEAAANLASQYETVVNIIYNRAYKKLKAKMDMGCEMLASVKKVINRRVAELELSNMDPENRRIYGGVNGTD